MDLIQTIILGVIQGLTEFLPISSSGHLVLAQHLMALEAPGVLLEIILHMGTIYGPTSAWFKTAPLALIDWGFIILASVILFGLFKILEVTILHRLKKG